MQSPTTGNANQIVRTEFPGGSVRSRLLNLTIRVTVRPFIAAWIRFPEAGWPFHIVDQVGRVLTVPRGMTRRPAPLEHCAAHLVTPPNARDDRFIVYLHGGGFLVGGNHLHKQMIGRFAASLSAPVLAVDYRKLPEHAVLDSIEDSVSAYRYALESGYRPEQIVIMGDSAGAYLTLMTGIEIKRRNLPNPAALVSISPLTDWDPTAKLAAPTTGSCALFPRRTLTELARFSSRRNRAEALPSPVNFDLSGLPPVLIQASSSEALYPDAELMADRLAAHGVPCELQLWPGQVHVFQAAASIVPEAAVAVGAAVDFVERAWQRQARQRSA
ncbi:alpha/beta hydrolase [Nocardia sp. NPDC006630]|uniref:alpha/beta hydrolase n=1 Tax=Nocardia sp. NPDC006630 TaxID=3157181 RepID=UPI0033B3CF17